MSPWYVAKATWLVYAIIISVGAEELKSALVTSSKKCQQSAKSCLPQSVFTDKDTNAGNVCSLFQLKINGLTAYSCLVRLGLCSEDEYDKLKVAACAGTPRTQKIASEEQKVFYAAVDRIRESCQDQLLVCVKASSVATVYKQHERYCYLLKLSLKKVNFRTCLLQNNKCEHSEFSSLNDSACRRNVMEDGASKFFNALLLTSPTCRSGLDQCSIASTRGVRLIRSEQYCEALHVEEDGKSAYGCLVQPDRCEPGEYDRLKEAVCQGHEMVFTLGTIVSCFVVCLIS